MKEEAAFPKAKKGSLGDKRINVGTFWLGKLYLRDWFNRLKKEGNPKLYCV